jgi:hypothetical protein
MTCVLCVELRGFEPLNAPGLHEHRDSGGNGRPPARAPVGGCRRLTALLGLCCTGFVPDDLAATAPPPSPDRCRLQRRPAGVKGGRRPSACRREAPLTPVGRRGRCGVGGWRWRRGAALTWRRATAAYDGKPQAARQRLPLHRRTAPHRQSSRSSRGASSSRIT